MLKSDTPNFFKKKKKTTKQWFKNTSFAFQLIIKIHPQKYCHNIALTLSIRYVAEESLFTMNVFHIIRAIPRTIINW